MDQQKVEEIQKEVEQAIKENNRASLERIKEQITKYIDSLESFEDVDQNAGKLLEIKRKVTNHLEVNSIDSLIKSSLGNHYAKIGRKTFIVIFIVCILLLSWIVSQWNNVNRLWDWFNPSEEPQKEVPVQKEPEKEIKDITAEEKEEKPNVVKTPTVNFSGDNIPNNLQRAISKQMGWDIINRSSNTDFMVQFEFDDSKFVEDGDSGLYYFEGGNLYCVVNNQRCSTGIMLSAFNQNKSISGTTESYLKNEIRKQINEILLNSDNYKMILNTVGKCI